MNCDGDFTSKWTRTARIRRTVLVLLILVPAWIATGYMAQVLPHGGSTPVEMAVLIIFALLYGWITVGFWIAMVGFLIRITGHEPFTISQICGSDDMDISVNARTAIVMPIYNEDAHRVFSGITCIHNSLSRTGKSADFDIFVLSDPGDPEIRAQEESAWFEIQKRIKESPCRVFYRQRRNNIKRKSGNIADFCRRWGRNYRYMLVLDADSIMSGEAILQMVRIMEKRPMIGILQTLPKAANGKSLIARVQQFISHVYGSMFGAGLNYWQLGDSQFWGHNAVIRVEPFMKHCALPRLRGAPPLGGDILSHDFVESALMRKAGYEVWLAYDLEGSFEELPSTLLDELKRDRRWCQGNMQHMRLLFTRGLYGAHRAVFLTGIMSYVSALLWFLFLIASTFMAILQEIREPDYFPKGRSLFPNWPVWEPQWAFVLMASTIIILFLPKICSIFYLLVKNKRARLFGGYLRLIQSFFMEILISILLAPARMVFQAKFVFMTLLGFKISWEAQSRDNRGTGWRESIRFHWGETVFALCWGLPVFFINTSFFWWLSPVLISLVLVIPLEVWLSSVRAGKRSRNSDLFMIPEETEPSKELLELSGLLENRTLPDGFVQTIVDPKAESRHLKFFSRRHKSSSVLSESLKSICEKALTKGPHSLNSREKHALLSDPASMEFLHEKVWEISDAYLVRQWQIPVHTPA